MNLSRLSRKLSPWREFTFAALVSICAACEHNPSAPLQRAPLFDTLSVIPNLQRDLPGIWMAPFAIAGSGEQWTLTLSDTLVSGTGTWSGEACCSGTVSIAGFAHGDSVHLDLVYTTPAPGVPPRNVHLDGLVDRPIDLMGVTRDASGRTSVVRYVKSTAVSPAGDALHRLAWWNEDVTQSVGLASDAATVYALSGDHIVSAVDKNSGKILWQTTIGPSSSFGGGSSLAVVGGLLVAGDIDLVALDPKSGKEVWRIAASASSTPGFPFVVDGTTIFSTTTAGQLFALDATTATTKWVAHVADDSSTTGVDVISPRVANGVVYVAFTNRNLPLGFTTGGVAAVDESSGKVLWSAKLPRSTVTNTVISAIAVSGAGVLATASSDSVRMSAVGLVTSALTDSLYVYDRQTGQRAASLPVQTISSAGPAAFSSIMTFGNMVLVGLEEQGGGGLAALDGARLSSLWRAPFPDDAVGLLASDGGRAYAIASVLGSLGVYDIGTGQLVWQLSTSDLRPAGERIGALPVFDDQYVYLGGGRGLYALRKN